MSACVYGLLPIRFSARGYFYECRGCSVFKNDIQYSLLVIALGCKLYSFTDVAYALKAWVRAGLVVGFRG